MRGGGGCGVSANENSCAHGAQINFGDLHVTPYLINWPLILWDVQIRPFFWGGGGREESGKGNYVVIVPLDAAAMERERGRAVYGITLCSSHHFHFFYYATFTSPRVFRSLFIRLLAIIIFSFYYICM